MKNSSKNFKFKIKNVRCFAQEQNLEIRPITFLVGENSTGKTSIMGCFSAIYEFIARNGRSVPSFNKYPYSMGAFSDIVNKKSKGSNFELGFLLEEGNVRYDLRFKEEYDGAEPIIDKIDINFQGIGFSCKWDGKKHIYSLGDREGEVMRSEGRRASWGWRMLNPSYRLPFFYEHEELPKEAEEMLKKWRNMRKYETKHFSQEMFNLAPIRSKPQRTYDPIKESSESEGGEIPGVLMRMSERNGKKWEKIKEGMVEFGKSSGLFSDIKIKKYGSTLGEPFQLHFEIRKNVSNIMDTGYGVSQVLPLLTRLFSDVGKSRGIKFLLQQPEVHLHPKAQAELASLLVQSATENNSFLIETHSDYMIDRTRIEIRRKNISPEQVSLIYLEPLKDTVKAHNLHFDDQGNLLGAPEGYRDFGKVVQGKIYQKRKHELLLTEDVCP